MIFPSREKLEVILEVARAPKVTVDCFGGEDAKRIWTTLNSRHPKFPLMRRKTFGAGMRRISDPESLFEGSSFEMMRRKTRRAEKTGYTFRSIIPQQHIEEIMDVNLSSSERQGRPIDSSYTNVASVKRHAAKPDNWFGVFDKDNILRAYTYVPIFGDAFMFSRILGNSTLLSDGIMYLLVAETMREMARNRRNTGYPNWAMYDMFIGGGSGLREFKRRTGFRPMRVTWRWRDK